MYTLREAHCISLDTLHWNVHYDAHMLCDNRPKAVILRKRIDVDKKKHRQATVAAKVHLLNAAREVCAYIRRETEVAREKQYRKLLR